MTRREGAASSCHGGRIHRIKSLPHSKNAATTIETMPWKIGHHMHETCGMLAPIKIEMQQAKLNENLAKYWCARFTCTKQCFPVCASKIWSVSASFIYAKKEPLSLINQDHYNYTSCPGLTIKSRVEWKSFPVSIQLLPQSPAIRAVVLGGQNRNRKGNSLNQTFSPQACSSL